MLWVKTRKQFPPKDQQILGAFLMKSGVCDFRIINFAGIKDGRVRFAHDPEGEWCKHAPDYWAIISAPE